MRSRADGGELARSLELLCAGGTSGVVARRGFERLWTNGWARHVREGVANLVDIRSGSTVSLPHWKLRRGGDSARLPTGSIVGEVLVDGSMSRRCALPWKMLLWPRCGLGWLVLTGFVRR